jgi:hypothetical protein|tara:strand:- start:59 stop:784 length:726 start_codon:yes stop_codon:yes gene_type:complete
MQPPIRKRRKKSKNYFTHDTELAIVRYNGLDSIEDEKLRSSIYDKEIHYPFFKLTQNIIHTFKFYHTEVDNLEHLQHEIIVFLLSKIHLFDPTRGAKAYSYFGTIVKRWLILYNTKNYSKKIKKVDVDVLMGDKSTHTYNFEESTGPVDELSKYIELFVDHTTENIYELFPKKNDAQIADAILELFRKRETIEVFNKKALYIYIREIVDVKTPKITKIADKLYGIFRSQYVFFLENGYARF